MGQSSEAVEVHQCRLIAARVLGNASLFLEVQADLKRLFYSLGAFDRANSVSQENLFWVKGKIKGFFRKMFDFPETMARCLVGRIFLSVRFVEIFLRSPLLHHDFTYAAGLISFRVFIPTAEFTGGGFC
ncbi:MAG: hypothetical protein LH631_04430 [Alkalinema sp. CAN_BIN05]|nr:hypothetical protein [Alkalinema sp. CAN_BIN05]